MGVEAFSYGMAVKTKLNHEAALMAAREALKKQGFGVLTEIDVRQTMKEKLGVEFRRYVILGACSPRFASRALEADLRIGLLLPCNVVVYEEGDGCVVAAIDPVAALSGLVRDEALAGIAAQVRSKLDAALRALGKD